MSELPSRHAATSGDLDTGPGGGSPRTATAAQEWITWPPSRDDLEAIEVIELAEPVAPAIAAEPPPCRPSVAVLSEVVDLDGCDGQARYIVDLRTGDAPPLGTSEPTAAGRAAWHALSSDPAPGADVPAVDWPPRPADIDAVQVLELVPRDVSRPEGPGTGHALCGTAVLTSRTSRLDVPAPLPTEAAGRTRVSASAAQDVPVSASRGRADASIRPHARGWLVGLGLAIAGFAAIVWFAPELLDLGPRLESEPAVVRDTEPARRDTGTRPDLAPAAGVAAPGSAAEPNPVPEASVEELLRLAVTAGDRQRVADLVTNYAAAGGTDPSVLGLADRILSDARANAGRARRDAIARIGTAGSGQALVAADEREARAMNAWRSRDYGRALRGFLDAQRAFAGLQPAPAEAALPTAAVAERPMPAPASDSPLTTAPAASPGRDLTAPPGSEPVAPVEPAVPATELSRPPVSVPTPSPTRTGADREASAAVPSAAEAGVRRALRAYQSAYETLDADAAAAVYPSVDVRALARAFGGLKSQKLEFEQCDVTTLSEDRARASCVGRSAYVPLVGNQTPKVEARRWTFQLERRGEAWRIVQAQVGAR